VTWVQAVGHNVIGFLKGTEPTFDLEKEETIILAAQLDTFGEIPESLADEEAQREPWSITFAEREPIKVRFKNSGFVAVVRANEFTSGDRRVSPMVVTVKYRLAKTATGLIAKREEEIEVLPPDIFDAIQAGQQARRMSVREQTGASVLRRRFSALFEPTIEVEEIVPPGRLEKLGPMITTQVTADEGWLVLGWKRADQTTLASTFRIPAQQASAAQQP